METVALTLSIINLIALVIVIYHLIQTKIDLDIIGDNVWKILSNLNMPFYNPNKKEQTK